MSSRKKNGMSNSGIIELKSQNLGVRMDYLQCSPYSFLTKCDGAHSAAEDAGIRNVWNVPHTSFQGGMTAAKPNARHHQDSATGILVVAAEQCNVGTQSAPIDALNISFKGREMNKPLAVISAMALSLSSMVDASAGGGHPKPTTHVWDHTGAFSTNSQASSDNSSFLSQLKDDTPLYALSLMGTHDTGASSAPILKDIVRTQTMSIPQQLKAGIRVMDFRLKNKNDKLEFYHGSIDLNTDFDDALQQLNTFLSGHPKEFVMIRLKDELDNDPGITEGNTRNFADTVSYYISKYPDLFWDGGALNAFPTLGDVRGKIILLADFGYWKNQGSTYPLTATGTYTFKYGWPYKSNAVIQDSYVLHTNWDLYSKWSDVKGQLEKANANAQAPSGSRQALYYINYLSGSTGSFPYFVAGGRTYADSNASHLLTGATQTSTGINSGKWVDFPRGSCTAGPGWICSIFFAGTNELTATWIAENTSTQNGVAVRPGTGIVMADFPGSDLIDSVIKSNDKFKK